MLPRFELTVAAGGREALLRGPAALAPEPGREQLVGEVSQAAEAFGIYPGMRLGEALARCPRLGLVAADPVAVADDWERVVASLEAIGAAVEAGRPGIACFDARGLRRLHGGSLDGIVAAVRGALRRPARVGGGAEGFWAAGGVGRRGRRVVGGGAPRGGGPRARGPSPRPPPGWGGSRSRCCASATRPR